MLEFIALLAFVVTIGLCAVAAMLATIGLPQADWIDIEEINMSEIMLMLWDSREFFYPAMIPFALGVILMVLG